jgi:hypothetical protein
LWIDFFSRRLESAGSLLSTSRAAVAFVRDCRRLSTGSGDGTGPCAARPRMRASAPADQSRPFRSPPQRAMQFRQLPQRASSS